MIKRLLEQLIGCHFHDWSKWKTTYISPGTWYQIVQERKCLGCGKREIKNTIK